VPATAKGLAIASVPNFPFSFGVQLAPRPQIDEQQRIAAFLPKARRQNAESFAFGAGSRKQKMMNVMEDS
jgi:hypothetical protein